MARIGTHSGNFHCDEALACYMLTRYLQITLSHGAACQHSLGLSGKYPDAEPALLCSARHTARFRDAEVVRSRDPEVLKDLDAVVDVGGVYDPAALRLGEMSCITQILSLHSKHQAGKAACKVDTVPAGALHRIA
jgi:hypothetical protein